MVADVGVAEPPRRDWLLVVDLDVHPVLGLNAGPHQFAFALEAVQQFRSGDVAVGQLRQADAVGLLAAHVDAGVGVPRTDMVARFAGANEALLLLLLEAGVVGLAS